MSDTLDKEQIEEIDEGVGRSFKALKSGDPATALSSFLYYSTGMLAIVFKALAELTESELEELGPLGSLNQICAKHTREFGEHMVELAESRLVEGDTTDVLVDMILSEARSYNIPVDPKQVEAVVRHNIAAVLSVADETGDTEKAVSSFVTSIMGKFGIPHPDLKEK